jgi:poly-gamma-glutamate synthesis protein (capsule biosynthesis protein)
VPAQQSVLTLAAAGLLLAAASATGEEARLLVVGDVLLSRQVEREIAATGVSPWAGLLPEFQKADLVLGNLEGAVGGESECAGRVGPCFAIDRRRIPLLAGARFTALSIENNHAGDLGEAGRAATRRALREEGVRPVDFSTPSFFRVKGRTVAVVALNLVPGPGARVQQMPSPEVSRALRLARTLADVVVVSAHWGEELIPWTSERQREVARILVGAGASVVAGHHPHVVQPPGCVDGRPVFFSLGNHLFDQKYPETKKGLVADCRISDGGLSCGMFGTETAPASFSPVAFRALPPAAPLPCPAPLHPPLRLGDVELRAAPFEGAGGIVLEGVREGKVAFRTRPTPLLSAESVSSWGEEPLLFTLERHFSPIDGEDDGVRPYVYAVGPNGLVARWRGSALAWPLVDARVLPPGPNGEGGLLCALHRGDSFLMLDPAIPSRRMAIYRWNGFGFSGVDDPVASEACRCLMAP